ncbi:hypothetical protein [Azospirillum argentinense]
MPVPHRPVGPFQVAGEAGAVEQRRRRPPGVEAAAEAGERRRIAGQPHRQRLVGVGVGGDRLGQAGGVQQAGGHARREAVPHPRHHRQAHPQGVRNGGVAGVGKAVEEQVGQPVAGKMLRLRPVGGEDQTVGLDPAPCRLAPQVAHPLAAGALQPQHAARHARQHAHPQPELRRGDLERGVERAEDETVRRQAADGAVRQRRVQRPAPVVDLIGVRQDHQPLPVIRLVLRRRDEAVADHIVHDVAAHRSRIAEIGDLDRRQPARQQVEADVPRVTLQVHQDVDALGREQRPHRVRIGAADVVEGVEGGLQPAARRATVVGAVGTGDDADAVAVVQLEQLGRQIGGGVFVEVGGEVGDGEPAVAAG